MKVKLTEDIFSNYFAKKGTKSEPIKYANKGEICNVISLMGDVYILQGTRTRFPCHKNKVIEYTPPNAKKY